MMSPLGAISGLFLTQIDLEDLLTQTDLVSPTELAHQKAKSEFSVFINLVSQY
jgi:hypothetical protein